MDLLRWFLDFVLHLDKHLADLTTQYGATTYAILFGIIFCETGLVVMPFLPGDSLLFAAGAVSAKEEAHLNPVLLGGALMVAAIIGDTVNYHIGKAIGPRIMKSETSRWLNKKHLERTHKFYEKHGGKTIIIARFAPILRTFAPFVAGAGAMSYSRFIAYNIIGGVAWVGSFLTLGYFFGNQPLIKKNFTFVIMAIVGDTVNYHIGKWIGPRVMKSETSKLFNKKHLLRTQKFFEKHGGKTIIIARFAPIIRTFAPFVAGAGAMSYPRFIAYNVIGAVAWVRGFLGSGYFFGNIPVIKRNFTLVIFAIIFLSILPGIIEYLKSRRARETQAPSES